MSISLPKEYDDRIGNLAAARQLEYYKAYCEHGSVMGICAATGWARSSVRAGLKLLTKKAAKAGLLDNYTPENGCAPGYKLKGTSTLYDGEGNKKLEWVKTNEEMETLEEKIKAMLDVLRDQVPVNDYKIEEPSECIDDLMSVYPMGDPHLGMFAWSEESGENFDCKICEERIVRAIDRLVDTQPASCIGRIENLGDFFHSDTEDAVTRRSGNHLDVDGRWGKVLRIGVRMMTHCIDRCLEKHKKVEVVNVTGNHDDQTAYCLSIILAEKYRNDPRVEVDITYAKFHYKEFGKVLIGCNHGMLKPDVLQQVMACDKAEAWGRTVFRYWHVGHIHHTQVKEVGGCTVEAFRSLKSKDAHEASRGYRAGRDMKAILYHKQYGEIERHTCNLARLMMEDAEK
jgi:hypothetical protein